LTLRALPVVSIGLLTGWIATAQAQTETRTAVAEALYRQARDLMAAGKLDQACPKFAESQRLDPATGTLLNLAACHEKQGKIASAWLEYSDAMVAARRDGREDRVSYARDRIAELEPKLSRLTLLLAPGADLPNLTLELDGSSVGQAVVGVPTPVDPGKHTVRAAAPGKQPRIYEVSIDGVSDQKSLTIEPLDAALPTSEPVSPPAGQAQARPQPHEVDELGRPIPTSVYLAGGITLALAVGAGASGIAYLNEKADYDELKTSDQRHRALTYGRVNLGLWLGTAVGAGVTTYLYVTRPKRRAAVQVVPVIGPQLAGMGISGGF
jgi:hypothetical protein